MKFEIIKQSKKSRARLSLLETSHGVVETPCLVPVATQAVLKTLTSEETIKAKCQILISNTFHLHLRPGEGIISKAGGLHDFMNWQRPLMTDSGGFQVFSLGFGHDLGVGKILKYFAGSSRSARVGTGKGKREIIKENNQPKSLKITDSGVYFQSPYDGKKLFLGPRESIRIQQKLGADIIFAFDECTAPLVNFEYAKKSLERTHKWAEICIREKKSKQALFGIVQGSRFRRLRVQSAKFINSLGFDGFGIGGDLGSSKKTTKDILDWVLPHLDVSKPRHLLGIGHLEDIEDIVKNGVDLFDCIVPTHYARHGIAFTSHGRLNLRQSKFLKDKKPLDSRCQCEVCKNYKRNYISHLMRAGEMTAFSLLTFHNLFCFNNYVEKIREKIRQERL